MGLIAKSPLTRDQLIGQFTGPETADPFTLIRTRTGQGEFIAHHAQGSPGERVLRASYTGKEPEEITGSVCHTEDHNGRHVVFSWFTMRYPCVIVEPYRRWVWVVEEEKGEENGAA